MRGDIIRLEGRVLIGQLPSCSRPLRGLRVLLDGLPAGGIHIRPGQRPNEFQLALPVDRLHRTLDIRDPRTGESLFGEPYDLSSLYQLRILEFRLDRLLIHGRFSIAASLSNHLFVKLLRDGLPASSIYAKRCKKAAPPHVYEFVTPMPSLPDLASGMRLSALIGGALEIPPESQIHATHVQTGIVGYVDNAVGRSIAGWAINFHDPSKRVVLELLENDKRLDRQIANKFRQDVQRAGIGDGKVGFRFLLKQDRSAPAGPTRELGVVVAGTRTHLVNSPVIPKPRARLLGFFEGVHGRTATGWACDVSHPRRKLPIEIVCDGQVVAADIAKHFRGDLETAGIPILRCGFQIDLGENFDRLIGKEIVARIPGLDIEVPGSPRPIEGNPLIQRFLQRSSRVAGERLIRLRNRLNDATRARALSIIMPVYNTPKAWLCEALDSVRGQWCDRWELICVDDSSSEPHVSGVLNQYAEADRRIRIARTSGNSGIAKAVNCGIRLARSDYVTFMDHDDYLEPDAVFRLLRATTATGADLLYSDEALTYEDNINAIMEVRARPAFSYDYYLSHPYFVHMVCVRANLARKLGGWNESMDISADVDFVLRTIEAARAIAHVPAVLYRWRIHGGSAGHAKQAHVMSATKGALSRHFERRGIAARVSDGPWFNQFRVDWPDDQDGEVAIIIPTRNKAYLLKQCIDSVERTSGAVKYRLIIVDHESEEKETKRYLRRIAARYEVLRYNGPFNFSRINNFAVRQVASGVRYLLFMNNDVEALDVGWIERLRSLARRPEVGVVGPLLLYGDRRVQHAGVIIGFNRAAEHAMKFRECFIENGSRRNLGYNCTLTSVRDFSAVTAACMMMRREVYELVHGFDEQFAIGFNDTDLCLRLRAKGLKVLYDGHTILLHHESATRADTHQVQHPEDDQRLRRGWARYFTEGDPFYHPCLDHDYKDHTLREVLHAQVMRPRVVRDPLSAPRRRARDGG
jgi:GT2 family glycosyltransferase